MNAGEAFLHTLYGGRKDDDLNTCMCFAYKRIVARQQIHSKFDMAILPPTCDSAKLHSFRVYHQVLECRGNNLPPTDRGWKLIQGNLLSVISLKEPAPSHVLQLISCNLREISPRNVNVQQAVCSARQCVVSVLK